MESGSGSSSTSMPSARARSRTATKPCRSATRGDACGSCGFVDIWNAAASMTATSATSQLRSGCAERTWIRTG